MSNPARTLRRAAERKALKGARKLARLAAGEQATQAPDPALSPKPEMIAETHLTANRLNALKSTGPRTEAGKSISARNHTSHGLTSIPDCPFRVLPHEDQSAYNASLAAYQAEWNPATATEHTLVERLATHDWLHRRALRLQDQILADATIPLSPDNLKQFQLFTRYATTHLRAYNKSLSDLMRLRSFQLPQQKHRLTHQIRSRESEAKTQIGFESQKRHNEAHAIKMQLAQLRLERKGQRCVPQRNSQHSSGTPDTLTVLRELPTMPANS